MGTPYDATEAQVSWQKGEHYRALFGVGKSRRYHAAMRDFYRRCADGVTAITALSGTSAFVALFLEDRSALTAKILIGLVAAASTLNLVYGFAKKADLHETLCRRFTLLAADIADWPADEAHLRRACAQRLLIEADEPPVRRVIDLRAHNDELRSQGVPTEGLLPLSRLQKSSWLGYFFDFGLSGVEARMSAQQAEAASELGSDEQA